MVLDIRLHMHSRIKVHESIIRPMERQMKSRKVKTGDEKSIPEMVDEVTREKMRLMYEDGKLTAYGRRMSNFLERALLDEKVDEWGWSLSRKERAEIKRRAAEKNAFRVARYTLKFCPQTNGKLRLNGRRIFAHSGAAIGLVSRGVKDE